MEELLTCSVCCERYCETERQPVLLPRCGHSFCRLCVTLLLSGGCIICPTCRTEQRVEAAQRLPTEYTLLAIIAAQDNTKLDNCRRHDVKLSFWCKTCSQATCGECLFEDHPTHSHEVVRASTYVQNIKDSVHEVACKFMEALDMREQTYYKSVYICARKIDDALRNVTVLRKDMGEARELMKGIKEDETSISTASSLAEAAKYLGLKWNIQDANYTRTQDEEYERDRKESTNEDKDDDKKEKVHKEKKKRKKSHAEKEEKKRISKELEDIKLEPVISESVPEISEESNLTTKDPEQPKDVKRKTPLRKCKTLSVFEPFSMNKEIIGIKNKIVELDNKERDRIEKEKLKQIEEEEQVENDKKIIENKQEEAKKAAEDVVEAINASVNAKEDELKKKDEEELKKKESEAEEAKKKEVEAEEAKKKEAEAEEEKKKQLEVEKASKEADEELEKLNKMLKKPRGRLARKYMAEKEKEEAETAKIALEMKSIQKSMSVSSVQIVKSEVTTDEETEKTNGGPENLNKDDESDSESDDSKAEAAEADPYVGELSLEDKKEKDAAEAQDSSKLLDFMKDPLFTVCVEGSEGRLAMLRWESMGLHIYCHQFQQLEYDIAIKANFLQTLIPSKSPIVFLELTVGSGRARRVYIRLWGHLRRAHNFLALCLGDRGSAFINSKLLQTYNLNDAGERILGGDHEYNCGRGGCGLLEDLEWNGDYALPMKEGLITAAGSGQHATNSLFLICTRSDLNRNFSCPFGEIIQGLDEVRDSIRKAATNEQEIWISDCGVVLEPPRV